MAYAQTSISAITDIPALVATAATAAGWTVDTTANTYQYGSGLQFTLTAKVVDGVHHELSWSSSNTAVTNTALAYSPVLANSAGTSAAVVLPQNVHIFTGTEPNPYIGIVVQYGDNLFRHLYLGYMDKSGTYSGGEVISAASPRRAVSTIVSTSSDDLAASYLFALQTETGLGGIPGGVYVNHASNPNPWRTFIGTSWQFPMKAFTGTEALGGYGNDVNDGLLVQSYANFVSASMLVPVPLYITNADSNFMHIGRPSGVRMVNMKNLDPLQEITVGTEKWIAFPAWCKDTVTSYTGTAAGYPTNETSYMVGYAYPAS